MKTIITALLLLGSVAFAQVSTQIESSSIEIMTSVQPVPPPYYGQPYYDWGRAQNGYGYCYEWVNGQPLHQGQPVSNYLCEQVRPSSYLWGRAQNGYGYCYQYTPYGVVMNQGQPQSNYMCERTSPSYFAWGNGMDGYLHCYQYTGNGIVMNQGQPVSDYQCRHY
jgi:hypothetical protein